MSPVTETPLETSEPSENPAETSENPTETSENPTETSENPADVAKQVATMLSQASIDGEQFYREYLWVRVLLWRMFRYRPEDFTDDEQWDFQVNSKLSPRDMHCMYAVLVLWNKSNQDLFEDDPKARVYSIYKTINFKKDVFASALALTQEELGIEITANDLKYDGELMNALDANHKSAIFNRYMERKREQLLQQQEETNGVRGDGNTDA